MRGVAWAAVLLVAGPCSAAWVLTPGGFSLIGPRQVLEGSLPGVEFPDPPLARYSSIVIEGTDRKVTTLPAPFKDTTFRYTVDALNVDGIPGAPTGLLVSESRYAEVHYTLGQDWSGSFHELRLNSNQQPFSLEPFFNFEVIPSSAGTHRIIIDLQSDDGVTNHGRWSGEWRQFRWDFFNDEFNGNKTFTIDKVIFANAVVPSLEQSPAVVIDAAGRRSSNGVLAMDGSLGGIGGVSVAAPVTVKHSYIGQLYDLDELLLTAAPLTVDEDGDRQVMATLVMDDGTLGDASGGFGWNIDSGPASVDGDGLVSGQAVYQDTLTTVSASLGSAMGTLDLTVLNTLPDNFGIYAGDQIDDDWQVLYFGVGNPLAGPLQNPDFDSQNNLFEFLAKVDPTDPGSFFTARIERVMGQPSQKAIVFEPRHPDRTYTVQTSTFLTEGSWSPLGGATVDDDGLERTVTDPSASGTRKFYRVQISRP